MVSTYNKEEKSSVSDGPGLISMPAYNTHIQISVILQSGDLGKLTVLLELSFGKAFRDNLPII